MEINRKHNRIMLTMVILFALAVIITGGVLGYVWYKKSHEDASTNPSSPSHGGTVTIDTTPKLETEPISTALMIKSLTSKPGDTIHASVLSMTVPKAWRTVNSQDATNAPVDSVYADSPIGVLAHLVMVPETQPADPLRTINSLSFYDLATWLTKSSQGQRGTASPAQKAAFIQNISNIGDGKAADKNVCAGTTGALDESMCGPLLGAKPISTSDGSLKGVVFFNTISQAAAYDPLAFVFLTGTIKGEQILAHGQFHILDNNSHTLDANDISAVGAAWSSFKAGTIPSDTQQLYQHVVDAMKTISIKAN